MPKTPAHTNSSALSLIGDALRVQARVPNMYAYEPHDKQRPFHASVAKKKLYIGGNRSGKTTAGIIEDLWWATGRHPFRTVPQGGVRGRIVSVDFLNGIEKNIIPQIKQWCPPTDLRGGSWDTAYDKGLRTLYFKNSSFIEFMSYDQDLDKFSGTSRHFIHFDEEPPQDIWTENKARLVDTGGSYWITMTPVEGMTWVYDALYEPGIEGASDVFVVEVSMTDNPHLSLEAVNDFLDGLDADERKAREHGQFVQLGGLIYKAFKVDTHVISPWRPPTGGTWMVICSLDHGYTNPTAWLWHAVSTDGQVITFFEHYKSDWTVELHAAEVHRINAMLGVEPVFYIGDPSIMQTTAHTGTSIYTEYINRGIPIVLGNNDVRAGINRVARYLKIRGDGTPYWVITEDCPNLIRELRRYRWKTYANKRIASANNLQEEPHKKDDHACDSARYFFMSQPDLIAPMPDVPQKVNGMNGAVKTTGAEVNKVAERYDDRKIPSGDYVDSGWTVDDMGAVW